MLKYLIDGGIFMWVILLASISGLAVIIEKMYTFLSKEKKLSEIEKTAKKYGANVEFTKIAKAEQYRETLAIEENMKKQSQNETKKIDEFQYEIDKINNL